MFTPICCEKLTAREDLTAGRSGRRDGARSWTAGRTPAQIAGLLVGLAMKGERPEEIVGLAADDAARAVRCRHRRADGRSTPAAPAATAPARSTSRRPRRSSWRRAACAWPSTATERCRAGAAAPTCFEALGVNIAARAGSRRALPRRGRHRVPLRARVPPVDAARRADAAGARRPDGVQPARPAHQPGARRRGSSSACRGRSSPSCWRGRCCCSGSERAWVVHGADGLDEISPTGHTKVSECRDGAVQHVLRPPGGLRPAARRRSRRSRRRRRRERAARAPVLAGERGPARDIVLLNAGAALLVAGRADRCATGIARGGRGHRQRRAPPRTLERARARCRSSVEAPA